MLPAHLRSCLARAILLLTLVTHAAAIPPAEIAAAARYLPDQVQAVAVLRVPKMLAQLISLAPAGSEGQRKVLAEQCQKFAKATGFDPMGDIEAIVLAVGPSVADGQPTPMAFIITRTDPGGVLKAIEGDKELIARVPIQTIGSVKVVGHEVAGIAFLPRAILVAPKEVLKQLLERTVEPAGNAAFMQKLPGAEVATVVAFATVIVAEKQMQAALENPQIKAAGGGLLIHLQRLTLALGDTDVELGLLFDADDAAQVAVDQLKGLITTAKAALQGVSSSLPVEGTPPLEHLKPRNLATRIAALSAVELLGATTVSPQGPVTRLVIPRDRIPLMRGQVGVALASLAASAVVAVGVQVRQIQEKVACHRNQQAITGALALYMADKKKKAALPEVAEDLLKARYLESKLDDPGQGSGTFGNYRTDDKGQVFCVRHGHAPRPGESESDN